MASPSADEAPALDEPPAEPNEMRSQPLSPVSPKPIHYPSPSNIPILENELDQNYVLPSQGLASPPDSHTAANGATSLPLQPAHISSLDAIVSSSSNLPTNGAHADPASHDASQDHTQHTSNLPDAPADVTAATDKQSDPSADANTSLANDASSGNTQELVEGSSAVAQGASGVESPTGPGASMDDQLQALFDTISAQTASETAATESAGTTQLPQDQSRRISDIAQSLQNVGASGSSLENSLPPTGQRAPSESSPTSETQKPTPANAGPGARASRSGAEHRRDDDDAPWGPEIQKIYDKFLEDERKYVAEGKWETFPPGSRLFVGNLPSERVTKRDIFHVFHRYGKLAQISIKQAYGFVQFLERESCQRAHDVEQGVLIRGKKVNLEISKPQRKAAGGQGEGRGKDHEKDRDRERDRNRERGGRGGRGDRDRDRDRRSPSPRGSNGQRVDSYRGIGRRRSPSPRHRGRERSPENYFEARRRSRSPQSRRRSPEPRRGDDSDDELPLPRRAPRDVPDIQIIVKDNVDQPFMRYVEDTFRARSVTASTLVLNPRLHEPAVFRRQILEGVLAVMTLDRVSRATSRFKMTIFEYSGSNVNYNEYADLEIGSCIALLQQARQKAGKLSTPYGLPMSPTTAFPGGPPPPGLAGTPMQMGGHGNMLGVAPGMNQPFSGPPPGPPGAPQAAPDLNAILATIGQHNSAPFAGTAPSAPPAGGHSRQSSWAPPAGMPGPYSSSTPQGAAPPFPPPALAGYPAPPPQGQAQGQPPQDMSVIMAQLSQYKGRR